jgi:hypothetical protein
LGKGPRKRKRKMTQATVKIETIYPGFYKTSNGYFITKIRSRWIVEKISDSNIKHSFDTCSDAIFFVKVGA